MSKRSPTGGGLKTSRTNLVAALLSLLEDGTLELEPGQPKEGTMLPQSEPNGAKTTIQVQWLLRFTACGKNFQLNHYWNRALGQRSPAAAAGQSQAFYLNFGAGHGGAKKDLVMPLTQRLTALARGSEDGALLPKQLPVTEGAPSPPAAVFPPPVEPGAMGAPASAWPEVVPRLRATTTPASPTPAPP